MMNKALKKDKGLGRTNRINLATWNIRGLSHKEIELQNEFKKANIGIAVITETKKKLKGTKDLSEYLLQYSGVPQNKRATPGVVILVKQNWKKRIQSYNYISDRIINTRIKFQGK